MSKKIKDLILEEMRKAYNDQFRIVKFQKSRHGQYGAQLTCGRTIDKNVGVYLSTNWLGNKIKEMKDDYIFCIRNREITDYIDGLIRPYMEEDYRVWFTPLSMYDTGKYACAMPIENILQELEEFDEFIILTQGEITRKAMENLGQELDKRSFKFGIEISAKLNRELYSMIEYEYLDEHEISEIGKQYCDMQYDNGKHDIIQLYGV